MQDIAAERAFYERLFRKNPENEHITAGYEEIHRLVFRGPPNGTVVDLGCGTGAHAVRLAGRGHAIIAIDLSLAGVRAARDRFRREGLTGRFLVADAERLPLKSRCVAVIWSSLLLHHFPKLDRLPEELARVTNDRLVAMEPNAQNLLTWIAFNLVNPLWGLSTTTPNQRALFPWRLHRRMAQCGFRVRKVAYVHRAWPDESGVFGLIRRACDAVARFLPARFRANKFLVVYQKIT